MTEDDVFAGLAELRDGKIIPIPTDPVKRRKLIEFKTSGEFVASFSPPDYLIDGVMQRRYLYSLTAPTGGGKTALALLFAASVALDRTIAGREVSAGRVLVLAGENPDDVKSRWIAMGEHMGFDPATVPVDFVEGTFSIEGGLNDLHQKAKDVGGYALAIVDTSAAFFRGNDENSNTQLGAHARLQRQLTTLAGGPCVLTLCHPTKNASDDNLLPRGGGAFLAEVDGNLICTMRDKIGALHWQGKFRGPDFEPLAFELVGATSQRLVDSKGRTMPTIIAQTLSDSEQRDRHAATYRDEDVMLVAMNDNPDASIADLAKAAGWQLRTGEPHKSKASRTLNSLKKDSCVDINRGRYHLTKKGKAEADRAKERGVFTAERYRNAS